MDQQRVPPLVQVSFVYVSSLLSSSLYFLFLDIGLHMGQHVLFSWKFQGLFWAMRCDYVKPLHFCFIAVLWEEQTSEMQIDGVGFIIHLNFVSELWTSPWWTFGWCSSRWTWLSYVRFASSLPFDVLQVVKNILDLLCVWMLVWVVPWFLHDIVPQFFREEWAPS
jgi:hypothetical protein